MHGPLDPFDPNTWALAEPHQHQLYLDDRAQIAVMVDEEDYLWAVRWRWQPKRDKHGRKIYAVRTQTTMVGGLRSDVCLFLHVEIMKRTGVLRPSPAHKLADHRNGNELDCRRENLRWATPSMNRLNLHGAMPHDLEELARA